MSDGGAERAGDLARVDRTDGNVSAGGGDRCTQRLRWSAELALVSLVLVIVGVGFPVNRTTDLIRYACYLLGIYPLVRIWQTRNTGA